MPYMQARVFSMMSDNNDAAEDEDHVGGSFPSMTFMMTLLIDDGKTVTGKVPTTECHVNKDGSQDIAQVVTNCLAIYHHLVPCAHMHNTHTQQLTMTIIWSNTDLNPPAN